MKRRLTATLAWAAPRHRPLEAALCAVCTVAGVALELGAGWALIVLGGLFAADLGSAAVAKHLAAVAANRRPR